MPLETLTMTGDRDLSSSGRKACVTRTMLTTFVSKSEAASGPEEVGRLCANAAMPTLLTNRGTTTSARTSGIAKNHEPFAPRGLGQLVVERDDLQ